MQQIHQTFGAGTIRNVLYVALVKANQLQVILGNVQTLLLSSGGTRTDMDRTLLSKNTVLCRLTL